MITVILDNEDVSTQVENINWSNTDPGGCEAASFSLDRAPTKGAPVTIVSGTEPVWVGRVDGPDRELNNGKGQVGVSCVGDRAKLTDDVMATIYLDRRLDQWQGIPAARRLELLTSVSNFGINEDSVADRGDNGIAVLRHQIVGAWGALRPITEAWYDAGPVALIDRVLFRSNPTSFAGTSQVNTATDANWQSALALAVLPGTGVLAGFVNTIPATATVLSGTASKTSVASVRYAFSQLYYNSGLAGGVEGRTYYHPLQLIVVGDHGLTLNGSSINDYYISYDQIAAHAAKRAGLTVGHLDTAQPNLQAVYLEEIPHETIVDEQAKLAGGYHWGVWPRSGSLASGSEFWFTKPPVDATAFVGVEDIDTGNLSERMSTAFSKAHVTYTDGAGSVQSTTVTRTSRVLDRQTDRTLQLDAGLTTLAAAQVFGLDVLTLTDIANRASGSLELPDEVFLPNGGTKPAPLLRAGVDRLRVNGLSSGPLYRDPGDTFRISRISCDVQADGSVRTTAEVDSGADLVEVLNARISQAALIA